MTRSAEEEVESIARALTTSTATIVIGAGASLPDPCAVPVDGAWSPEWLSMPSGDQLAGYLAQQFKVERGSLALTAQRAVTFEGTKDVRRALNRIFSRPIEPGLVHRFCAGLAERRSAEQPKQNNPKLPKFPLFVTTNYDDLLERALIERAMKFDLLYYNELPHSRVALFHTSYSAEQGFTEIREVGNRTTYDSVDTELRPCVIKIHGSATRPASPQQETDIPAFIITEDDYIRYLASINWKEFFPATIGEHLADCHYLLLGHSLADWNLRVMLHQITQDLWTSDQDYNIWVIKKDVDRFEARWGQRKNIQILRDSLSTFIPSLERAIGVTSR